MMATLAPASAKTIDVEASFTVLADVFRNVVGDHVKVKGLVPPNGDAHDYEPSPDDAKAINAAAATFLSGAGLAGWFERLAKAAGAGVDPIIVSDGIKTHDMEDDGEQITDPHVWNSAATVLVWIDNIEAALVKVDPEDEADIKASADTYRKKIEAPDASIKDDIAAVPEVRRKVMTSHDASGYYGVTFLAPLGVSTEVEPSASDVANLI